MKFAFSVCALLLISSLLPQAARAETFSGTWDVQPSSHAGSVYLELRYRHETPTSNTNWSESGDVPLSTLRGIGPDDLSSGGVRKSFSIAREPGEFRADGWFAGGHGSGAWTFAPSQSFRSALARRGLGTISDEDALRLATANFSLSTLDALQRGGFQDITVTELVRMTTHGVTADYIRQLDRLGYRPNAGEIVRLVDHGVSIAFIERMRAHGYGNLSADDLIRLRDHGF